MVWHSRAIDDHGQVVEDYREIAGTEKEKGDDVMSSRVAEHPEYPVDIHQAVPPHVFLVSSVNNTSLSETTGKRDTPHLRWEEGQNPVLQTDQSPLHFTPWKACSLQHHFGFSGKHSAPL